MWATGSEEHRDWRFFSGRCATFMTEQPSHDSGSQQQQRKRLTRTSRGRWNDIMTIRSRCMMTTNVTMIQVLVVFGLFLTLINNNTNNNNNCYFGSVTAFSTNPIVFRHAAAPFHRQFQRNIVPPYDTALHQEKAQSRTITASTTTTIPNTNPRFINYKYFVNTLPSFLSSASSTATASKTTASRTTKTHGATTTAPKQPSKFHHYSISTTTTTTSRLLKRRQKQLQRKIRKITTNLPVLVVPELSLDRIYHLLYTCILPCWYLLPSLLCFVPIFTWAVWQTIPVTPDVWKLVNMDFIWWYYTHQHEALSVIGTFLASNASFFGAAFYLLHQSHRRLCHPVENMSPTTSPITSPTKPTVTATATGLYHPRPKIIPSSLGYWVLAAGIMSTIFHTVQACGNYRIAEALCYLDHGIAGTAVCHFYSQCGAPSLRTLLCGIVALVTLAFPITSIHLPSYTTLHSIWHALAAVTAVLWASDARQYDWYHPSSSSTTTTTATSTPLGSETTRAV